MKRKSRKINLTREEVIATAEIAPVTELARYYDISVEAASTFKNDYLIVRPNGLEWKINCNRADKNAWDAALIEAYISAVRNKVGPYWQWSSTLLGPVPFGRQK